MIIPVILLNYNSTDDCRKCILSLQQQSGVELEIVVVDNCSAEENRLAVELLCKETGSTFIANTRNAGYNAGNNVGLRYAAAKGYEFALIANPDMEFPYEGTIRQMVSAIVQDDNIVALGTDVITKTGVHQNPRNYGESRWQDSFSWIKEAFQKSEETIPHWIENPEVSHYCLGLNGCCLLLRMSFIQSIGFFDERIFLYGEETIFAQQVRQSGKRMYYISNIQVVHDHKKQAEGNPMVLCKHWKHSRLHAIRFYSNYPWFGKMYAYLSIWIYFAVLNFKNIIKRN